MADAYGASSGCCDALDVLIADKAKADQAKADAQAEAIKNGSCKDDEKGLKADWGDGYTCKMCVDMGFCTAGYEADMLKWCAASCNKCSGSLVESTSFKAAQVEAAAKSMQLIAERMRAKENQEPSLVSKYLQAGYPDLPELNTGH